jgi:hypothetical protein
MALLGELGDYRPFETGWRHHYALLGEGRSLGDKGNRLSDSTFWHPGEVAKLRGR